MWEVRREMSMPPDAQVPRMGNTWDRARDPTTLQANSSSIFSAAGLMKALESIIESASLSLNHVSVVGKPSAAVARR